jgi:circadian clock protein KaiC
MIVVMLVIVTHQRLIIAKIYFCIKDLILIFICKILKIMAIENEVQNIKKVNTAINDFQLLKSPTGIKGFDDITLGGIPKFRPTLVVGAIGCGKTFMAMEYIINGVVNYNEPGVFMTFEEKADELLTNVSTLGYDISSLIKDNKIYLEHLEIGHNVIKEAGTYKIDGLFVRLEQAIDKVNAKRVVLDSMDTLFGSLDTHILRSEFKRLFTWLKDKKVTAIVTAEVGNVFVTRMGLEELIADCVIELTNRVTNQIATRRLRILKYRGSLHALNEYPFVIDENRMTVFPLISQGLQQKSSTEHISSGILKLDEMLANKGFYIGSSILISGTSGTGKSSVAASFANYVCTKNQTCLFCAFEEAPNQILRNMLSIGLNLQTHLTSGNLQFYFARPSLQNLELHFMAIKEIIIKIKPSVILLDPITNLMTEGPNSDVRSMLTRFIDYLKTKQITVMFTAAITIGSIASNPSDEGISSMVDTWIMVEDIELEGERNRSMYVMKARGMNHSKEVREFVITSTGINLIPILRNKQGILIGSKRVAAELHNKVMADQQKLPNAIPKESSVNQ